MSDPSLSILGPVRQFFSTFREKIAKGRVISADTFNLSQESAQNAQSFVVHDPILIRSASMKDLKFSYLVTSAEGFYYRQEHEYRNLPPTPKTATGVTTDMVMTKLNSAAAFAEAFGKGDDSDGLEMVLSISVDGVGRADVTVKGVSYKELSKFQRYVQDLSDDFVTWGEDQADDKDRRRGWGKAKRK